MATRKQFIEATITKGVLGDDSMLKAKLATLAGLAYDSLKPKGTATAAGIAALVGPKNGDTYRVITTGGNLNSGGNVLAVIVGDVVWYDEGAGIWKLLVSAAAINV